MSDFRPRTTSALRAILTVAIVASSSALAMAQTTVPNPLRGPAAQEKTEAETAPSSRRSRPKKEDKAEAPAKPKRERSAKQKENDDIMRACGATWRTEKAALQGKGETWRSFLKDCRAKRKNEQKA